MEYLLAKGCTLADKDQAMVEAATKRSGLECFKLLVETVKCNVNARRNSYWHFDSVVACYVNSMSAREVDPEVVSYLLRQGFDYRQPQVHYLDQHSAVEPNELWETTVVRKIEPVLREHLASDMLRMMSVRKVTGLFRIPRDPFRECLKYI